MVLDATIAKSSGASFAYLPVFVMTCGVPKLGHGLDLGVYAARS